MKTPKKLLASTVLACLGIFSLSATASFILIGEDFTNPPNTVNESVWTKSGAYAPLVQLVANGQLTMRSKGWAWHNVITTVDNEFNFFEKTYSVSIGISGFPEPNWETDPVNLSAIREVFFVLGPSSNWGHYVDWNDQYYKWDGFGFSLRWQVTSMDAPRTGRLELFSPSEATGIGNPEISNVPTAIDYSVGPTEFTIELTDATFVDTGLSTMSGTHTLDDSTWDERYYFMLVLHQSALTDQSTISEVVLDHIIIATDEAPTSWAGYPIMEDQWVDTGDALLGRLYVAMTPWIYSEVMQRWIYLPERNVVPQGAWWWAFN